MIDKITYCVEKRIYTDGFEDFTLIKLTFMNNVCKKIETMDKKDKFNYTTGSNIKRFNSVRNSIRCFKQKHKNLPVSLSTLMLRRTINQDMEYNG